MNTRLIFHCISYLQYPLMVAALHFVFSPIIFQTASDLKEINSAFILMGLAISFSTLQDTTKTQNKLSKIIWENPRSGKITLIFFTISAICIIAGGLYSYFNSFNPKAKEVSIGLIVLGIGFISLIKAAIETFENHRRDKRKIN